MTNQIHPTVCVRRPSKPLPGRGAQRIVEIRRELPRSVTRKRIQQASAGRDTLGRRKP